jgi:membrane dipeptidase
MFPMNRRRFLLGSAIAATAWKLNPQAIARSTPAEGGTPGRWDLASRQLLVIDGCGGINSADVPLAPEILRQCLDSGVTAFNWTVSESSLAGTMERIYFVQELAQSDPKHFQIVRSTADIARVAQERAMGFVLGFQDPAPIEPGLEKLETFRRQNVLIMQLTYNHRSLFGDGCLEPENRGLTKLGLAAVERMNELGIAVDLSHCGQRTTAEGIAASKKPVLITHAGCSALHAHPRNKDDRELKALADRGGVVGIYFMPYLVASPTSPAREHVLAHLDHALKVAGTDHVGIGTDNGMNPVPDSPEQKKKVQEEIARRQKLGIAAPEEDRPPYSPDLNVTNRLEIIADGLEKLGYDAAVNEKVLGKNFYRALGEIWLPAGAEKS